MKIRVKRLIQGMVSVIDISPADTRMELMTSEQIMYLSWFHTGQQLLEAKDLIDEQVGSGDAVNTFGKANESSSSCHHQ